MTQENLVNGMSLMLKWPVIWENVADLVSEPKDQSTAMGTEDRMTNSVSEPKGRSKRSAIGSVADLASELKDRSTEKETEDEWANVVSELKGRSKARRIWENPALKGQPKMKAIQKSLV